MTGSDPVYDSFVFAMGSIDVELLVPRLNRYLDTVRIGGQLFLCLLSIVGIMDQYGVPALIMSL